MQLPPAALATSLGLPPPTAEIAAPALVVWLMAGGQVLPGQVFTRETAQQFGGRVRSRRRAVRRCSPSRAAGRPVEALVGAGPEVLATSLGLPPPTAGTAAPGRVVWLVVSFTRKSAQQSAGRVRWRLPMSRLGGGGAGWS